MTKPDLGWLTARPIAHRGLHDHAAGVIENSPSAFKAAIAAGYAIECDVRLSADDQVMVFHDATLDRLTQAAGPVSAQRASALRKITLTGSKDCILTLPELLELVAGKVPLVIELKTPQGDEGILEQGVSTHLDRYQGHAAAMSFNPVSVGMLRKFATGQPRGLVAEWAYDKDHWPELKDWQRFALRHLLFAPWVKPHFIAYDVNALTAPAPRIAKRLFGMPLLTWTVRGAQDLERAGQADQIIFEGFRPE